MSTLTTPHNYRDVNGWQPALMAEPKPEDNGPTATGLLDDEFDTEPAWRTKIVKDKATGRKIEVRTARRRYTI